MPILGILAAESGARGEIDDDSAVSLVTPVRVGRVESRFTRKVTALARNKETVADSVTGRLAVVLTIRA